MAWLNDLPDFNDAELKALNKLSKNLPNFFVTVHSLEMSFKLANKVTPLATELLKNLSSKSNSHRAKHW